MAYIITKTNGDTLLTVPDTERNDDYSVTLVGRNYSGYGVFLNDNFVKLMENFANGTAPASPLSGQLWFSTTTGDLSLWTGTSWKLISHLTSSSSAPSTVTAKVGNFWWDTENYQLKIWTGETVFTRNITSNSTGNTVTITSTSDLLVNDTVTHVNIPALNDVRIAQVLNTNQLRLTTSANVILNDTITFTRGSGWYTVGPIYTRAQRINGIIPTTVLDVNGISHVLDLVYADGTIVATISKDLEYTLAPAYEIENFSSIKPGIQTRASSGVQIAKTVDAFATGAGGSTTFRVGSIENLQTGDYFTSANVSLSAGITVSALYGNNAVTVATSTTVYENEPVTFQRGGGAVTLFNGTATNSQQLGGLAADAFAQLSIDNSFEGKTIFEGNVELGAGNLQINSLNGNVTVKNIVRDGGIAFVSNISTNVAAPVLTISGVDGLATVLANPTATLGIATKGYVDTVDNTTRSYLASNVTALIDSAPAGRQTFGQVSTIITDVYGNLGALTQSVALRPYAQDAALTGSPTAPTAPTGTANTMIATTAFVTARADTDLSATTASLNAANTQIGLRATILNPSFTGVPLTPNAAPGDSSGQIASTFWVNSTIANLDLSQYATLSSPTFTNTPAAPTANISANTTQLATTAFVHTVLPVGMIMMWYGTTSNVPYGWQLCNGDNGTPDLRDRFVIGAGAAYNTNTQGGAASNTAITASNGAHSHAGITGNTALSIAQMPNHTHPASGTVLTVSGTGYFIHQAGQQTGGTSTLVANTGGGQGHDHTISSDGAHTHSVVVSTIPPYYALCYIMKVI